MLRDVTLSGVDGASWGLSIFDPDRPSRRSSSHPPEAIGSQGSHPGDSATQPSRLKVASPPPLPGYTFGVHLI